MIVIFFINPHKAMLFILKGKAEGLRHMYMPITRKGPVPQNCENIRKKNKTKFKELVK